MGHVHHEWLEKVTADIAADYERLRAGEDPQWAGHGGEETWARLFQDWLPPAYEVGIRKYIVPEEGDEKFETDLVVFNPAYPERLRSRVDVLAGGVAAAFSVKLTLNVEGLRDGIKRAAKLRRATKARAGTARTELLGAFPVGLLAHSSFWKKPGSKPEENITRAFRKLDGELARHPRESLDFLCVADLNTWGTAKMAWWPPDFAAAMPVVPGKVPLATEEMKANGLCVTAITKSDLAQSPAPVALFIARLMSRLSASDPALVPLAEGLHVTNTMGTAGGPLSDWRLWSLADVYSDDVRQRLPTLAEEQHPDWNVGFF
jgi:hypothetical protein